MLTAGMARLEPIGRSCDSSRPVSSMSTNERVYTRNYPDGHDARSGTINRGSRAFGYKREGRHTVCRKLQHPVPSWRKHIIIGFEAGIKQASDNNEELQVLAMGGG
jgi:hypothetical protein